MLRVFAVFLLAGFGAASAQPLIDQAAGERLLRQNIKSKKKEILAQAMDLNEEQARKFWQIQGEYEREVTKLNDSAFALLDRYSRKQGSIDDAEAGSITREGLKLDKSRLALRDKYFQRMAKALSPRIASRFIQIESLLHNVMAVQLSLNIPLVD